jgi:hypothetical protein
MMLSSALYAQLLLALSVGSTIASPVPEFQEDLPDNVLVLTGSPEVRERPRELGLPLSIEARAASTFLLTADQTNSLILHNKARGAVKVPPVGWDFSLQAAAQAYANQMAKSGTLAHSPLSSRPNQGENLAYVYSTSTINFPISVGTQAWIDEKSSYKGDTIPNGDFGAYGHYTQIVWNTTTRVGIATASDGKGTWYTVARYSPPGNYAGERPY